MKNKLVNIHSHYLSVNMRLDNLKYPNIIAFLNILC
jgi:hypothetical protein